MMARAPIIAKLKCSEVDGYKHTRKYIHNYNVILYKT